MNDKGKTISYLFLYYHFSFFLSVRIADLEDIDCLVLVLLCEHVLDEVLNLGDVEALQGPHQPLHQAGGRRLPSIV